MKLPSHLSKTTGQIRKPTCILKEAAGVSEKSACTNERKGTTANRQERRTSATTFTGWTELPAELRVMVLEEVTRAVNTEKRRLPDLSSVCKEWQVFFEGFLCNSFNLLGEEEVAYFGNIMRGHRCGLVKRIHLHVELEKEQRKDYGVTEDETTIHLNNQAFSRSLLSLLKTLSEWRGCGGLTLELSASSPKDVGKFWSPPSRGFHSRGKSSKSTSGSPKHTLLAWSNSRLADLSPWTPLRSLRVDWPRKRNHSREHTERIFGNLLDFVLSDNDDLQFLGSAKIPAVSRLFIRLQCSRSPSPQALEYIIRMLPNVEEVAYKPWRGKDQRHNELLDLAYWTLLTDIPKEVKRVSFWEESDPWTRARADMPDIFDLARVAAKASRQLQTLYAPSVFDALDFFLSAGSEPWPELRHLALTSPALKASVKHTRANKLLLLAGRAASKMPKLELMELWHCEGKENQCFFRYERKGITAGVTIESSWKFRMDKETNTKWTETTGHLWLQTSLTVVHTDLLSTRRTG